MAVGITVSMLARVLLDRGVCSADLDDALQEVVVAAWRAIREVC